ncbi:divalent metal cation transporter (plasmid) [Deinococcus metallilatus]|uniref:Divalent metal cation transporter n=1 Tax=Deinococcus metallilatus TaxID=1211322 RepID=A0AAJ5F569_9DEIO|nr:divalent metal cation transporter [Deinococcus metallilatus]MBB5293591.1 NRAMP (natural resistance-associated macrophage protein)-like metal ion transporter [Deinococcus metallilatus]QBY07424.1 divalent metal cation transporter [Deinococcus metallilatus]RXJ14897.1 divalent metal cation transporter [Deinococcus metallilatus]TLK31018.1 divalent metal cation transporter [Deinococcus metallilatus]GMA17944.1 iron transporter [Deinococcus metallilatus]
MNRTAPRPRTVSWRRLLGPGLITGASDDDPSGIATYSQVGAQFGFGLLWTMLFTFPLMAATQEISARIGRVTGRGLASNLREFAPAPLLYGVTALLVGANVINLGADLGAMGAALHLLIGGHAHLYTALLALLSVALLVFVPYSRYVRGLRWLTLALFTYVATVFVVRVPWSEALRATLLPHLSWNAASLQALVAVLGTTISPYLFFWQASQEVEDSRAEPGETRLRHRPDLAPAQFRRIRLDTLVGMGFSNLVAYFIILTAAVTLHASGQTHIATAAQAAQALRPVAGRLAFALFALGIVGTGLLAVPVLTGSAAFAVGEALRWPVGLARRPLEARGFYLVLGASALLGVGLNFTPVDPIRALVLAAVVNGVASAPVMAAMLLLASSRRVMGEFVLPHGLKVLGWIAALVMLTASVLMLATLGR